jgi:DNA-binding transcriptional LysR family regulator
VLVMPAIFQAVKEHAPQLLLRNVPLNEPDVQLAQFQTDLIIESGSFSARALGQNVLYADNLVLVCRQQHPALSEPLTIENLRNYDHSSFMTEGQSNHGFVSVLMKFSRNVRSASAVTICLPPHP